MQEEEIDRDKKRRKKAKGKGVRYESELMENEDTLRELLVRSRYLLYKSPNKWSDSQQECARILFL